MVTLTSAFDADIAAVPVARCVRCALALSELERVHQTSVTRRCTALDDILDHEPYIYDSQPVLSESEETSIFDSIFDFAAYSPAATG